MAQTPDFSDSTNAADQADADVIMVDYQEPHDDERVARAVPAWILSIVVHAVVLGLLGLIVLVTRQEVDEPAISITQMPKIDEVKPPVEDRKVDVSEVTIPVLEDVSPKDVVMEISDIEPELQSPTDDDMQDEPQGEITNMADSAMGGEMFAVSIGASANISGKHGTRGKGKKGALIAGGGGRVTEALVNRSLLWFKRHQSPNGMWDVDGYAANCMDGGQRCEPGSEHTGEDGDIACTAYALLCFLGSGYDHRLPSKYRQTVANGLAWLQTQQDDKGRFGKRNYEHAIATMALTEALSMSFDPALKEPGQRAVDVLRDCQIRDSNGSGLGWDYLRSGTRNDASVSGWCVMALKDAKMAELDIGDSLTGAKQYLERAWQAANPNHVALDPYKGLSSFPYTWNQATNEVDIQPGKSSHDMAPVGALMAVFMGHLAGDPMLETMANHIEKYQTPTAYPLNTYYLYYNTLAIFQTDEQRWDRWNKAFVPVLEGAQRRDGCFDGSFDYEGTVFHGHKTGRLLSTAYCCLSLEVYYRYADLKKHAKKAAN